MTVASLKISEVWRRAFPRPSINGHKGYSVLCWTASAHYGALREGLELPGFLGDPRALGGELRAVAENQVVENQVVLKHLSYQKPFSRCPWEQD